MDSRSWSVAALGTLTLLALSMALTRPWESSHEVSSQSLASLTPAVQPGGQMEPREAENRRTLSAGRRRQINPLVSRLPDSGSPCREECVEQLIDVLLDTGQARGTRKQAARLLLEAGAELAEKAILTALLSSDPLKDCRLNLDLAGILAKRSPQKDVYELLEQLSCQVLPPHGVAAEVRQGLESWMGGALTHDSLGVRLAYGYLGSNDPKFRKRLALVESPYLAAARIAASQPEGEGGPVETALARLASSDGALGPLLFLAEESNLPSVELERAALAHVLRYRNAKREVLARLAEQSPSPRGRFLASAVLTSLEMGAGQPNPPRVKVVN